MLNRVKRLKLESMFEMRRRVHNRVDGVDLHRALPPEIRNHPVFGLSVAQSDRLRRLLEEIHHRRTAQPEGVFADRLLELRCVIETNQNLQAIAGATG